MGCPLLLHCLYLGAVLFCTGFLYSLRPNELRVCWFLLRQLVSASRPFGHIIFQAKGCLREPMLLRIFQPGDDNTFSGAALLSGATASAFVVIRLVGATSTD